MGHKLDKFLLLMWKNWVLQYRKPIQTIVEILAPVLFSIILVLIRSIVDPESHDPQLYEPYDLLSGRIALPNNMTNTRLTLLYSPNNSVADSIMQPFGLLVANNVIGFKNAESMEQYYAAMPDSQTASAVQFSDNLKADLPENLEVKLRFPGELHTKDDIMGQNTWMTNLVYPIFQTPGPRNESDNYGASPNYYYEGFLTLQYMLSISVMCHSKQITINSFDVADIVQLFVDNDIPIPLVQMQRFPHGKWQEDVLLQPLISFVGILIMLSFVYTCLSTVRAITTEKEKQLKEAMKIMGLSNWLHWTAWFLKTFIFLLISSCLIVVLLKVKWYPDKDVSVFTKADWSVMLVFLLLYMCATITFCFAVSVFFSKANTAATIAGLCWFLSYAPYLFMQNSYATTSLSTKLLTSLGSNSAMSYGFQLMLMFEGTEEGIQWSNVGKPNTPDDNLTLGLIMMMLIIDTFIYLIIALYVEAVFPGEYGVPQPWNFPFTARYWCGQPRQTGVNDFASHTSTPGEFFEQEPQSLHAGIQIKELRKVFAQKAAVRSLNLNMYEDQITVLLGHNGAGKTTTMSMLTGMYPPTSGTAVVNGYDIATDMDGVRDSLGLCPQHNIIFDDLTVKEHLYFFSKLKGLQKKEIDNEIKKYIDLLELVPKTNAKASTLSGGMKRKLCVGMALCGNSKIVMLDEPTAGMDPSARRALWDLLQSQKEGRTMLLTTHFMDEADLLGDRIAIMAGGELQCCGSSFFLKKKYGAGYSLIMDKSPKCDPHKVTRILKKYIPSIEIHGNVGSELTYLLIESESSVFENMLHDLEQQSESLGILSYGISLTTLEEVFMKVGADHGQEETYNNDVANGKDVLAIQNGNMLSEENKTHESKLNVGTNFLTGAALLTNQVRAMFMKKMLSIIRTWILQIIQILLPMVFLILVILVGQTQNTSTDLPAMPLTLSKFKDPVTVYNGENVFADSYKSVVKNSGGVEVTNITETLLDVTTKTPITGRMRYIVGASFSDIDLLGIKIPLTKIWYNNDPYHSPGVALGLTLNAMYQQITNSKSNNLKFSNHPMPYTVDTKIKALLTGSTLGFNLSFNLGFSMAFVSSFYILFYVRERVCKSKHLQFVSGVKVHVFWVISFLCDFVTFLFTSIILIITLVCFQEDGFKTVDDLGRIFLLLIFFGWCMLPMMYVASFFFEVPSTGYTRMSLFSIFTGCAAFLVVQILATPGFDLEYVGDALHWIFLIVPHYALSTGIKDSYLLFSYNKICDSVYESCILQWPAEYCKQFTQTYPQCQGLDENYFKWAAPGIGRNLLYSFLAGAVLMCLLFLIEYKTFDNIINKFTKTMSSHSALPSDMHEDEDVLEEKIKIRNSPEHNLLSENTLVLRDVTKYYKNFLAVNSLSLGVKNYECFGLLGVNGAGKTTTFKMMTGDEKISSGDAWVNGFNLNKDLKQVQKSVGYCPQFDALLDDLTARETLTMFSLLRGIPADECKYVGDKLAKDFDFYRHLDKKVKELSGGNKRKLSTSIALIGDPPVVFLDEPTTGMDPATKRYLWNALCQVRDSGKCIVLTSHSMEECEALCTRLAIMVNGNFKCLGSTQRLKNKFAEGYTLTIKPKKLEDSSGLQHTETAEIEQFIQENFPSARLREKHQELLNYYITDKSVPWSRMFGILETAKRRGLNIEDYSLGQCSLEQVFLTFTKHQL